MKRNDSKVLARIKRVYKSYIDWYVNKNVRLSNEVTSLTIKKCESFKEFLDFCKYAKLLRKTRVPFRSKMGQIEQHYKNKKSRVNAKKQIQEGIQEFENRYED